MNILFCSVGRRAELLKDFRKSMGTKGRIVVTENSETAPAIYFADKYYLVPKIDHPDYVNQIEDICRKEKIDVITTVIDPEIEVLSKNRDRFEKLGVLAPDVQTAELCFDKFKMYKWLTKCGIRTVKTFGDIEEFEKARENGEISYPVFVKPRCGSGSVGTHVVTNDDDLKKVYKEDTTLIIREYMGGALDIDADVYVYVYVDTISNTLVSIFTKRKLSTKIGGANKTVSFKDDKLVDFILSAIKWLKFYGSIDIDSWKKDGAYYLSEVNPRFGGAYLHAYGAGVDFVNLIENNVNKIENTKIFNAYDDNILMMYDAVVIVPISQSTNWVSDTHR